MLRKWLPFLLILALLIPSGAVGAAPSPVAFKDIENHWAKEQIHFLAQLGIFQGYKPEFKPDEVISRGEALILLNRTYKTVYGVLADPVATAKVDPAHGAAGEIRELVGNLNQVFVTDLRSYSKYDPGENMLYYLYLSSTGKPMKYIEYASSKWTLSGAALNQPLSREEASMVMFHALAPYFRSLLKATPLDVEERFTSYYKWKQPTNYLDNQSPFATALQILPIYTPGERNFYPTRKMTRAEYATILKRFYDGASKKRSELPQIDQFNLMLTAASHAYKKQNQQLIAQYFDSGAIKSLADVSAKLGLPTAPLHTFSGTLYSNKPEYQQVLVNGHYQSTNIGNYEVMMTLRKDENPTNPYGWTIQAINYNVK